MIKNSTHYELNTTQLDQALAILRKEQQVKIPSRWQRISYVLLSVCVYVYVASLLLGIIFFFIKPKLVFVLLIALGVILVFLTLIVLPLNVPLLRKLRHQIRLMRSLGLSQFFKVPWQAERRKRRFQNILALLVVYLGLLGTVSHFFVIAVITVKGVFHEGPNWPMVFLGLITMLFDITICLAVVFFHLMRRYQQRLEVVGQLQSSLTGYKHTANAAEIDESTRINIPTEEYEQIAQIERAQILFEREMNIFSFEEPDISYYSIQKSPSLREALDKLDMAMRLVVEHQIDDLTSEPKMPGVTLDPETNISRLRIPETNLEIAFTVDNDSRRLKILSLQFVADDATSSPKPGD